MLYQTHALIHLDNIRYNLENIRKAVGTDKKIMIAVKGNAYGHGAVQVASMAADIGIDWLGVSTVPEALELRQAGIKLPILKFTPVFKEEMAHVIKSDIAICVCNRENIVDLNEIAKVHDKKVEVHLKIDTGMGRIGAHTEESVELAELIVNECSNLKLGGAMTHLPVSDEANLTFTQRQIKLFSKTVNEIEAKLDFKFPLVHCANSGAVLAHPEGWFNMVRPGIMIYGYFPSNEVPQTIDLKPGLSFKTKVSFIKKVSKGASVGYGRTWVAPKDTWVATFSAGYADGFNRLFSNTGRVLINGTSYPVVGRVCMGQSMCNLGPETNVTVGDEVVLIGKSGNERITTEEWAEKLGTITYEVTCQISSRVVRVYSDY